MASQLNYNSPLPQGFSVYQPALGAQLQFFPALGTPELDDMMNAYLPGPAPVKEKRATISLDFLEHTRFTGQTFKFYAVYSSSFATALSSFNVSPDNSAWDWNQASGTASASSSRSSTQSRKHSQASSSSAPRHPTTDFSHLPGMKIMTKDGQDVTNSASRGSKTKEQRDHAHLMRIIKACDSCRRKKIRCDPSHKKRPAPQSQVQPAAKVAKKARTATQRLTDARAAAIVDETMSISPSPIGLDPTFSFTGLECVNFAAELSYPWEEFVQYPADVDENYDFFLDPEGYLSSQSPTSDSSASPTKSPTRAPQHQELLAVPGLQPGGPEVQTTSMQLPFLDQPGLQNNYTDFNLFSPESTFSEDERMVSISATHLLCPSETLSQHLTSVYDTYDSDSGVTDCSDLTARGSPITTRAVVASPPNLEWYDPSTSPGQAPSNGSNADWNLIPTSASATSVAAMMATALVWTVFIGFAAPSLAFWSLSLVLAMRTVCRCVASPDTAAVKVTTSSCSSLSLCDNNPSSQQILGRRQLPQRGMSRLSAFRRGLSRLSSSSASICLPVAAMVMG